MSICTLCLNNPKGLCMQCGKASFKHMPLPQPLPYEQLISLMAVQIYTSWCAWETESDESFMLRCISAAKELAALAGVKESETSTYSKMIDGEVPMGVSQWAEHGKKFGYWEYFKNKKDD